jgi:hypothetical protein
VNRSLPSPRLRLADSICASTDLLSQPRATPHYTPRAANVIRCFQRCAEARSDTTALPLNASEAHCSHSSPSRLRICFQLCGRVTTQPHKVCELPEDWYVDDKWCFIPSVTSFIYVISRTSPEHRTATSLKQSRLLRLERASPSGRPPERLVMQSSSAPSRRAVE